MSAGYSGTPLVRKLGFRPGWRVAVLGAAPENLDELLGELPPGVRILRRLGDGLDAAWIFVVSRRQLERRVAEALPRLPADGTLWISWPKRSSGVPSDVTENVLREVVLPTGWVDIKVAAIDETWSGLRFALRREERR
jgi:hypothetical protein